MNVNRRVVTLTVFLLIILGSIYWWRSSRVENSTVLEYTVIVEDLEVPWSVAITDDGEFFLTERNGAVNHIVNGDLNTIHRIDVYRQNTEGGLLGIALDPRFSENQYIYLYYTYQDSGLWNRVVRYTYRNESLVDEVVVLDGIPGGRIHDGGRIKFGPDGLLYISTGETGNGDFAQDPESLAGKILRVFPNGSIPEDNPFSGSPVFSIGHRNPQGLAWHPETERLYISEHGPSGEGLAFAHDEINLIVSGGNYGWPDVFGEGSTLMYIDPVYSTGDETWAPSGVAFFDGGGVWGKRLFVACLRGNGIRVVELVGSDYDDVGEIDVIFSEVGRVRTVVIGPDGYMYFLTSNMDGRGIPRENGDILARFKPPS